MAETAIQSTPPKLVRPSGRRVPSGARPAPLSLSSPHVSPPPSRVNSASASTIPLVTPQTSNRAISGKTSLTSLGKTNPPDPSVSYDSPLNALLDTEHDFTVSPEGSPTLLPNKYDDDGPVSQRGSKTSIPTPFSISRPSTPTSKPKPKPSRLNTTNLASPSSPVKAISPGLRHWQQVRTAVLAPTPIDRPISTYTTASSKTAPKKLGIVSKAAGRFGFRHAADNVMGYDEKRRSNFGIIEGISIEEQEEIARERRKFARDVKNCLDACAAEESLRRLYRASRGSERVIKFADRGHSNSYSNPPPANSKITFDPNFSAFAPLLTELHKHLPAARSKRLWSRTCPHHDVILAELGTAFLADGTSTDGERQQALEVFGAVVKNWAPENANEELERWLWLCRAILTDDRQVRNRGLTLLSSFLNNDPSIPRGSDRPTTAQAFLALAAALIRLLHALETSSSPSNDHLDTVNGLLTDLSQGDILEVEETSLDGDFGSKQQGGIEKELLWTAIVRLLDREYLASWLTARNGKVLKRFLPSPILHATPPIILHLRAKSCISFFVTTTKLVGQTRNSDLVYSIWKLAQQYIIPEARHLPDDGTISDHLGRFVSAFELLQHDDDVSSFDDPAQNFEKIRGGYPILHRHLMVDMLADERGKLGLEKGFKEIVSTAELGAVLRMIRSFLESKEYLQLGREALAPLWTRLSACSPKREDMQPFLIWLAKSHPQLLYKPLFSLAASTQPSSLIPNLETVKTISSLITPSLYWTHADAQMVMIVLMGDVGPKVAKGKGKEGERGIVHVKLGRYAVLIELIRAFDGLDDPAGSGTRLRAFIEALETRLGVLLAAEETESDLPGWYRSLICSLLLKMRMTSLSFRRTAWQKVVLKWSIETSRPDDQAAVLQSIYKKVDPTGGVDIFSQTFEQVFPGLLVAIQACLVADDWMVIMPYLWRRCADSDPAFKAILFLLLKCSEIVPEQLREVITTDIASPDVLTRATALRKLASIYGWRYQVLSQKTISDRRGPIFQFPTRTLEYVQTEIGSATWVAPHDMQDKALQKFGPALPFELRQRLMELGWSKDNNIADESDWEKIPITKLPILLGETTTTNRSPSPTKSLSRRGSSGSGDSLTSKRRRAIVSPRLLQISHEQALQMSTDDDAVVSATSRELSFILQRNDPQVYLRPFIEGLDQDFVTAMARLRAVCASTTPGFAYFALNAIVGYLKTTLRSDPDFPHYAMALTTVAHLIPNVSQISLREIRKNKAEHVVLPASIHEEEGGFKLHQPWRDNLLDVQTAQLLILKEILIANPRDVYLVKKMLSNLQIQASLHHLPFSRAWLILVGTLFRHVNRNYNDRSELRHFLQNVAVILKLHGTKDIVVTTHAMRVFILCSARFRRLFTSMGFTTVMSSVYETFANGNSAVRDCIEYCGRSFYRIHQDSYVYQTCAVISEGPYDPLAVYELLAGLSSGNTATSGIPSGIRGLNDSEEIEALVAMISRPEIALSEIGTAAAERQAIKIASVNLEDNIFPRENILKLLVTVIAANPTTKRAINFIRLFSGMLPHFKDTASQDLLRDSVEALGSVIAKGRVGDESLLAFDPGVQNMETDWMMARREYIFLVEAFAKSGGQLGAAATRRALDIVVDLLRRQPESVGPAAANIVRELAKTHLSSAKPLSFLREISNLFRQFINVVDFSGLLDSVTAMIRKSQFVLDAEIATVIIREYIEPAVRMLASASEDRLAFVVPLRASLIRLLGAAVFLEGDALGALEQCPPSAGLFAALVIPLCMILEPERDTISGVWIRLLRFVTRRIRSLNNKVIAAASVLSLQCIKIIVIRASESISSVQGLWSYISRHLLDIIKNGHGKFTTPRVVDWMMWSLFELLSLHRLPLQTSLRAKIQTTLAAMYRETVSSRPSTPDARRSPQAFSGRARHSSRSPSIAFRQSPEDSGRSRMPSQHLSPILGHHARMSSFGQQSIHVTRPSFSDLSARRASRPVFDVSPGIRQNFRFPSSAPVRSVGGEKGIVHLLGAPAQVLSATSSGFPTLAPGSQREDAHLEALKDISIKDERLVRETHKAVKKVQMVFGYEVEADDDDEPVRTWTVHDALHVIAEQTKILIEAVFSDVFNPHNETDDETNDEKLVHVLDYKEDFGIPDLSISSP